MPIVIPVPIPAAPAAPQRNDPATFEERNDAAVEYQFETLPAAINEQAETAYQNALDAHQSAEAAEASKNAANGTVEAASAQVALAAGQAGESALSAAASEASHRAAMAVAAALGDDAGLPSLAGKARQALMVNAQGSGVEWQYADSITRTERISAITLTADDKAGWIDITDGTFTQTFAAFSALGAGWWCYLQNSGTGDITIPSSDGRTNWIMYPGEMRLFQCDGTALRTLIARPFYKVFTTSGNFIKPPGYVNFDGHLLGGGGSGGSGHASGLVAGGGAGGGLCPFSVPSPYLGSSEPVVIGSGGAAVSAASGTQGGSSTCFGLVAAGGLGGGIGSSNVNGGAGAGVVDLGNPARYNSGSGGSVNGSLIGQNGLGSKFAGAGGGGAGNTAAAGGVSGIAGHGGAGGDASSDPMPGVVPAGGGGGVRYNNSFARPSGAGARGELRIWGII